MATATASHIPEIIKLQLRKPKHWNWELSTSKSSPNITMPIIKLYDYKGNLLVEAKDNGTTTTSIYGSDLKLNEDNGSTKSAKRRRNLIRSRSDSFGPPTSLMKKASSKVSINSQDRKQLTQRSNNSVNSEGFKENSDINDQKTFNAVENSIFQENEHEQKRKKAEVTARNRLEKSKSDLLYEKRGNISLTKNVEKSQTTVEVGEQTRHRRSRSDDLFRRKLRYNSEESIKRAELDGYRNFITPNIPNEQIQSKEQNKSEKNKKSNRSGIIHTIEAVSVDDSTKNIELSELLHKQKYTTRTSSAGTLIIPKESFQDCRRRRRRRRDGNIGSWPLESAVETKDSNEPAALLSLTEQSPSLGIKKDSGILREPRIRSSDKKYIRQTSHSTTSLPGKHRKYAASDRPQTFKSMESSEKERKPIHESSGLFHSYSDVFLFKNLFVRNPNYFVDKNNNCCEIDSKSETRENVIESRRKIAPSLSSNDKRPRERCKIRRKTQKRQESSSSSDETHKYKKGHLIREHSAQREKATGGASAVCESGGDANDLLKLVRRLSYSYTPPRKQPTDAEDAHQVVDDDVNMGANVSRHSAKGLGRRSQSSGSICNGGGGSGSIGKGNRHPEGKICSSLPSYLDDRDKNGTCNNNHDGKHHLDAVDRIPPLGDGAPLHWKFSDTQTICDQGYGSERSPEEEYPPNLTSLDQDSLQCHHHLEPHACYPFITPESTFVVKLTKGSRGLGLSVTGGIDSTGSWPGLIRIKRLFPHQPASACGLLNVGDLLLEANGITLTGLTNYEALEVLRTAPNQVDLKICRPPPDVLNCVSPISEVPPPPPRREPPNTLNLPSNSYTTPEDEYYHGEFEITLKKIQGSLGFTLRKEDDSALGHYVRALVREPALTDGRIRAGDKIIAVNDVEICPMSHEHAVQFLRQCPEIVKLRLYRDSAQTPVATLSPTETTPRTSFSRKAHLRQEAMDMLNDLAGRKLCMNTDIYNRSLSPNSSPRRLRRHQFASDASQGDYVSNNDHTQHGDYSTSHPQDYEIYHEQFHEGIIQKCPRPFDEDAFNSLFSMESDEGDRPNRPSSLELYNPNQTPVACRKPRFNFSLAHNAYELNNLDAEVLDAPNLKYNLCNEDVKTSDSEGQEPVSMPHIPTTTTSNFSYKHPAYQSAHPQINPEPTVEQPPTKPVTKVDDGTIRRRKKEERDAKSNLTAQQLPMKEEYEVLAIELNRGWNSRLGFSLQGAAGVTYVSAVHADSVAARDGRLKPGDRLIKVNDESIEHMTTSEVIDLLRIVRGPVCIVVSRVKSNEDCPKSNAEN
ncbi:uncharacterized protein LOC130896122 isoform X2 [Diorhabda carinulata]|uniref:uncharacterized protein LOC130896122 isoform X2 n=1 Tax=Diorhabda carinulata TaxID=1163345 RepID=UPI0025A25C57|nr:uncharacterized protein LOC130896122 isoform X2 [Diorhabda carinulata]